MKTLEKKTIDILSKKTLAIKHPTKKGGYFYQLYKVNFDKNVTIGGLKEPGYMLKFLEGKESNLCLTYLSILKIAHAGLKIDNNFYTFI